MHCRSIADILRGMGEVPPSDMETAGDGPPAPSVSPWLDPARIRAATARDVLERLERGVDDRTLEERRADGAKGLAVARLSRPPVFKFGAQAKSVRWKVERTAEVKEYYRTYMRERRARDRDIEGQATRIE
jgi:hypothetical protein